MHRHGQWCGVGVEVARSPSFGPESDSESLLKETPTPGIICFIWTYV